MNLQNQPNIWELSEWHQIKLNTPLLGSIFSFGSMDLRKVVRLGKGLKGKSKGGGVTVGSKTTIYKGFGSRAKYNHARIKRYRLI